MVPTSPSTDIACEESLTARSEMFKQRYEPSRNLPVVPPSPSADIAMEEPMSAMRVRSMRPSLDVLIDTDSETVIPSSSFGLPPSDVSLISGITPPARSGWVPLPTIQTPGGSDCKGAWQRHPDKNNWIYQPEEAVYFHLPSDTLWREDASASSQKAQDPACVHVEPAFKANSTGDGLPSGTASSRDDSECFSSGSQTPTQELVQLPALGWVAMADPFDWEGNSACVEWLREPIEHVYFHTVTETLWCQDYLPSTAHSESISIRPVKDAGDGWHVPPGTPECSDEGDASDTGNSL